MVTINRLKDGNISLHTENKVIKADHYSEYVESEKIIGKAEEKAKEIELAAQKAYQEAIERGYQEGKEKAAAEFLDQRFLMMSQAIDYFEHLEKQVVEIIISVTKKIFDDYEPDERISQIAQKSLKALGEENTIKIRVCSDEAEGLRKNISHILDRFSNIKFIDVIADEKLRPGSCIVESGLGNIDASIDTQLKTLRTALEKL
ncbi:HrpE/YscL family type III secretion apparatus protein [Pleionea sp. CnH1-48]|uniref:HrpE/YscL family type III secretion apparatus protein n=1 Tax=Pleionea sp. CnH1-48 TaxID=2954494 RepID=UPI002096DA5D|nr:HrpE/YscL family type III secretion apparatus protein [Pleionea sp. CnH1-48]MCO7227009.1 HrpE/YscL family type III secretion apparatus protein [Pleionea sp. CnH1-48]